MLFKHKILSRGLVAVALVGAVFTAIGTATAASAASYNGPFGTSVAIGSATCWFHKDNVGTSNFIADDGIRLFKDLVLEGPSVAMGGASSFGVFSGVKWTIQWYSLSNATGSTWHREPDYVYWGRHDNVLSTTWTFGNPKISINSAFSGRLIVYEKLEYVNSSGQTLKGGTFGWVQPPYVSHIQDQWAGIDRSYYGVCAL
jgi:hypothetical protein